MDSNNEETYIINDVVLVKAKSFNDAISRYIASAPNPIPIVKIEIDRTKTILSTYTEKLQSVITKNELLAILKVMEEDNKNISNILIDNASSIGIVIKVEKKNGEWIDVTEYGRW